MLRGKYATSVIAQVWGGFRLSVFVIFFIKAKATGRIVTAILMAWNEQGIEKHDLSTFILYIHEKLPSNLCMIVICLCKKIPR